MIQKDYRFKSWDGFIQIVLKKGTPIRGESFSLKFLKSDHPYLQSRFKKLVYTRPKLNSRMSLSPKFAVVVSKKVSKSAVTRNRIRRRTYEWLRLNMDSIDSNSLVLIFPQKSTLAKCSYQELSSDLQELFRKAGLI